MHIYTDFSTAGTVQVLEIFAFSNKSGNAVVISTDGSTIPFIQMPEGASNPGYEAGQDSAPFVKADQGLAVVPSDKPYSIIAFFNLPYEKKLDIKQPLAIDMPSLILLVPDGVRVQSSQLETKGLQQIQGNNYLEFSASGLKTGQILAFSVSGQPAASAGGRVWIRIRDGSSAALRWALPWWPPASSSTFESAGGKPVPLVEAEFETADEVLDAILALDDLHQAGKI